MTVKEVNRDNYTIRGVYSTAAVDRHGEIVDQTSWKLEEYMQNPVVLWGHDHSQPAIGRTIELGLNSEGQLEGVMQFAVEQYEFAKTVFELYAGGFMRAFSVGFMSDGWEEQDGVTVLKDNVLYEISTVNVPANAEALMKAKAAGIDVSALEKAGRVLSAKNRSIIEQAHQALTAVLSSDATDDEEGKAVIRSNDSAVNKKVSRTGDRNKKALTVLNKAIRALQREQRLKANQ